MGTRNVNDCPSEKRKGSSAEKLEKREDRACRAPVPVLFCERKQRPCHTYTQHQPTLSRPNQDSGKLAEHIQWNRMRPMKGYCDKKDENANQIAQNKLGPCKAAVCRGTVFYVLHAPSGKRSKRFRPPSSIYIVSANFKNLQKPSKKFGVSLPVLVKFPQKTSWC